MTMPSNVSAESRNAVPQRWTVDLVQAGRLQEQPYADGTWTTAIYKTPLAERVEVNRYGIVGDEHTGNGPDLERALCCCPSRHYTFWRSYLRMPLPLGTFGENLTLGGLDEADICIGDVLRIGSVLMQVSQPRMPCYKQARRIGVPEFVKLIMQTGKPGFLVRILEPGSLQQGDTVELIDRPQPEVALPFVLRTFMTPDAAAAAELAALPVLANEWRERFRTGSRD